MNHLRRLFIPIVFIALSAPAFAQGWEHIYPAEEAKGITGIAHWNGDTAFACGVNWSLLRTTDAGTTWEYLLHGERKLDFIKITTGGGKVYLRAASPSWRSYFELNDTTCYIFSYDPVAQTVEDISFSGFREIGFWRYISPLYSGGRYLYLTQSYIYAHLFRYDSEAGTWSESEVNHYRPTFIAIDDSVLVCFSKQPGVTNSVLRSISTDAGESWATDTGQSVLGRMDNIPITSIQTASGLRFIAADAYSVHVSDDTCRSWASTAEIPWQSIGSPFIVDIAAVSETHWYVLGYEGDTYTTLDGGATWVQLKPVQSAANQSSRAYSTLAVFGGGRTVAATTPQGIMFSPNGGITWDLQHTGTFAHAVRLHFFDTMHGVLLGRDRNNVSSIFETTDGGVSWVRTGDFEETQFHALTDMPSFNEIYSYTLRDSVAVFSLHKTTDQGRTWEFLHESTLGAGIEKCYAFGEVYTVTTSPLAPVAGLYYSYDRGKSWAFSPVPVPVFTPYDMQGAYDADGALVCYLTLHEPRRPVIYKTTDSCKTLKGLLSVSNGSSKSYFSELDVVNADTVFAKSNDIVHYTYDGGNTWDSFGIPPRNNVSGSDYVYVPPSIRSLDGAVRVSITDDRWNSHSVQIEESKLTTNAVWFFLDSANGWLASGAEIYRTSTGGVNWVRSAPGVPEGFGITSVYPNPVTMGGSVNIQVTTVGAQRGSPELRRAVPMRVAVHDILGREVVVLHEGPMDAQTRTLSWNTQALRPGLYFITASSGTERHYRTVVLTR